MPYSYTVPDLSNLNDEQRISLALEAVKESPLLLDGRHELSLRQAAKDFQIPRLTLTARYNGVPARKDAYEHQQKLTRAEERILVDWIKVQGRRCVPISPTTLGEHAAAIAGSPVGRSWPQRFMDQHPDLKTRYTQSLKTCRANNVNPTTVNNFFDVLEEIIWEYKIDESDVYNMDEKGVQLGVGKRVAAIIDQDQKEVYSLEDGNRELVTVIETVCADGTALPPSFIFKAARINLEWGRDNPCHARCKSVMLEK